MVAQFLSLLFNGLTLGAIYALIALSYTMVYGVLKLINFAYSGIFTLGAYAAIWGLGVVGIVGGGLSARRSSEASSSPWYGRASSAWSSSVWRIDRSA